MRLLSSILYFAAFIFTASLHAVPKFSVTTPEIRLQAAHKYLKDQPDELAVYVKGLVCSSCGIGLRIHLSKLPEIDKQRFNKGILMDASKQLVIVAFKPQGKIDTDTIRKAIDRAGYEAAHYYRWNGKSVDLIVFPAVE